MKENILTNRRYANKLFHRLYLLLFIAMAFTGFGQMPIFKRYYLSDVPGMAWTADFYFTHYLHYVGASLLLALIAYLTVDYLLVQRKSYKLTHSAYLRILLLGGIIVTGIFRVLKNLPDVVFSPGFTLFIDVAHLGFMMIYAALALVLTFCRCPWLVERF
jgi:hypothetical protein